MNPSTRSFASLHQKFVALFRFRAFPHVICWTAGLLTITLITLTGCATSAERAKQKAAEIKMVEQAIANRDYYIQIDRMYPRRSSGVFPVTDFFLQVQSDTLISYLPYIGRAYEASFGNSKGLNFTAPILGYKAGKDLKNCYQIRIQTRTDEDVYSYFLSISENGTADIHVTAEKREGCSYSGSLNVGK